MGVNVAPLSATLTTQEPADYLGISRPTLVRILERGEIPMEKPGRHRFVRLKDLVDYQGRTKEQRRAALEEMVSDAEKDHLYETGWPRTGNEVTRGIPGPAVEERDRLGAAHRTGCWTWLLLPTRIINSELTVQRPTPPQTQRRHAAGA